MCPGDTAQLCATPGLPNYLWKNGQTTTCINIETAGSYAANVFINDSCVANSNAIVITLYPLPEDSIIVSSDTLRGGPAVGYRWYLNNSFIPGAISPQYVASVPGSYTLQIVDSNGCRNTSNPVIISGLNQLFENNISIYPNPSEGNWMLTVDNNLIGALAEVFDATGQLIYKSEIGNPKSEIAFNAASGIYELCIKTESYTVVRKLVKF